jgi:dTDP-4-dehydrorhamnose reductase
MKLLISGAQGQLGLALARRLGRGQGEHDVTALRREAFDLADANACRAALERVRPEVLLNCAAYTAVDRAESEPDIARIINDEGPRHLAMSCRDLGIVLIHFSTDYVFDGTASTPYAETDATAPTSVYGQTKLDGELAVAALAPAHLILRLSWVYGNDGANFYKTMLRLAADRPVLRVVGDQVGVPNYAADLADAVACALNRPMPELVGLTGLYHVSSRGRTTWRDFAYEIVAGAGLQARVAVTSITTSEYPTAATRPAFSVLNPSKFERAFGWPAPKWQEGLQRCFAAARTATLSGQVAASE